jgi:protein phosphatase
MNLKDMLWRKNKGNAPKRAAEQVERAGGPAETTDDDDTHAIGLADYDVLVSLNSDVGCVRQNNEDCGTCITPGDERWLAQKGILAIVADGMGGHSAGEVASKLAVNTIGSRYYESQEPANEALRGAFREANQRIYAAAQSDPNLQGMGTTCTALALRDGHAICAHVGDSRLYLMRDDAIYLLSEDHSAVMEMVRRGLLTRQAAQNHPDKNVLLRSLGTSPEVEVSGWEQPLPLRLGDQFLLCSDGLYELVTEAEMKQALGAPDVHAAGEQLVALAKARGGLDNITVGLLKVSPRRRVRPEIKSTRELEEVL